MLEKLKGLLIEDIHKAHKFLSVQLASGLIILSTAYDYLPAIKEYLPTTYVQILAGLIIFARIVRQK